LTEIIVYRSETTDSVSSGMLNRIIP